MLQEPGAWQRQLWPESGHPSQLVRDAGDIPGISRGQVWSTLVDTLELGESAHQQPMQGWFPDPEDWGTREAMKLRTLNGDHAGGVGPLRCGGPVNQDRHWS